MTETDWNAVPGNTSEPDFENLLAVLRGETPSRPTLFEFFLNGPLYRRLAREPSVTTGNGDVISTETLIRAFKAAGYDYTTLHIPDFAFPAGEFEHKQTRSLNEGTVISDRTSFETYAWPDPATANYGVLDEAAALLPDGMKFIVPGPGGVLENVIQLVGYENLCFMLIDDPDLTGEIFTAVGSRIADFYSRVVAHPAVGAIIGNDDWGFKSQPMLSPDDMRRYVFPCHRDLVKLAHDAGKPAILHSCGNQESLIDDIIDDLQYDGKHSYEDAILPVEDTYELYQGRIAVMGGIDVDFVCRHTPQEVYDRSKRMLERVEGRGGFALGTGNSVPEYVPDNGYFAMIRAALDGRG